MIADPAVVLIDMQKDFCTADCETTERRLQSTVETASDFLDRYRDAGYTPILVRTIHDGPSTSAAWKAKYPDVLCKPETSGAEFASGLSIHDSDIVVTKRRYSGFFNTPLDTYLSSNDISHLIVGGVQTNVCVASTVHDAFNRDYEVTVLADCTASDDIELHNASLRNMEESFANVRTCDEMALS